MYLWTTDPHFNLLKKQSVYQWGREVKNDFPSAKGIVITGDISTSNYLESNLKDLAQSLCVPVYFVLGNHDYWGSSIDKVDDLCQSFSPNDGLFYLNDKIIRLSDTTALVGSSGFYDAIYGDHSSSSIEMNDWSKIEDFKDKNKEEIILKLREVSAKSALNLLQQMMSAQKSKIERLLIATHCPPFSNLIAKDEEKIPYYGSGYMGNAILSGATTLDEVIVLCGHCHEPKSSIEDNKIFSYCGSSKYGVPEVIGIFDESDFEIHLL